jgi:acetyltransferase-like isoleucine patch superfamily enzyme
MFKLDDDTDPQLREQILRYHLSEVLTDRERARLLGLPEGCRIRERAKILAQEKLTLGRNVWIGEGAMLDAQGGLTIGDFTQIGMNVLIWSHSSHQQALQSRTGVDHEGIVYKPTHIGKNCFIVGPSVIAAGVTIGDRAMILPLTFVDRDVPADTIVSSQREVRQLERRLQKLDKSVTALLARMAVLQGDRLPPEDGQRLLDETE